MFRIKFDIPLSLREKIESQLCFDKVKQVYTTKKLYDDLIKVIDSKPILLIKNCGGYLGLNDEDDKHDTISIDPRVRVGELPGVLIHELFHSLFPQLIEPEVLKLEFWFMKKTNSKQVSKLVSHAFKKCGLKFIKYTKRVVVDDIGKRK